MLEIKNAALHLVTNRTTSKLNKLYQGTVCIAQENQRFINLSSVELTEA